jgi:hypothetical protein
LGDQILRLNGFVNPYSQVKWIFSIKMARHKALVLFKLNSHAKMAPDTDQFASRRRPERGQSYLRSPRDLRTSPANDDELGPIEAAPASRQWGELPTV